MNNWRHINREKLEALMPCIDRWENYLEHYSDFDGDIVEFLELEKITPKDKVWVFVRVAPRILVEVFAIDCAFSAVASFSSAYTDAASVSACASYTSAHSFSYYAHAYDASSYAAASYAAYATAYAATERERQVDAMIMICEGE